jgi:hypothetical protein
MKISTGTEGIKVLQGAKNSTNKMVKAKRVDKHQLLIDRILRTFITHFISAFDTFVYVTSPKDTTLSTCHVLYVCIRDHLQHCLLW